MEDGIAVRSVWLNIGNATYGHVGGIFDDRSKQSIDCGRREVVI